MQIEVWSDIVCPWCYIGKRRLEEALEGFEGRDEVEVVWRSFELDPGAPATGVNVLDHVAAKYGIAHEEAVAMQERVTAVAAEEGLEYHLDRARRGNSFDAHRLLHLAREHGRQDEMKERLLRAYFSDGEAIGDPEVLRRLAADVGLDAAEVVDLLEGDRYSEAVRDDERVAQELGCRGVPFFVVDRTYGVAGAQDAATIRQLLERAAQSIG